MAHTLTFPELIRRVREGDQQAAAQLVREYEPEVRRAIRVRLSDQGLGRHVDSADICQSVLTNLFVRLGAGQFELQQPEQLIKLLMTMARNKLRDEVRKQSAARRDQRREEKGSPERLAELADTQDSPSQIVALQELVQRARRLLSEQETQLVELRSAGLNWPQIAAQLDDSPEALRKQFTRAMDRVAQQLGLDDCADD